MTRRRQLLSLFIVCLAVVAVGAWGITSPLRPSTSAASQASPAAVSLGGTAAEDLARQDFPDAVKLARQAIARAPNAAENYGTLGDAEAGLGDYGAMDRAYQRMVDLRASLAAYTRVSSVRWLYGDEQGAARFLLMAIHSGSTSPRDTAAAETQLGDDYFNAGFLLGAEAIYKKALHTLSRYSPALAGLAEVNAGLGRTSAAIQLYKQALAVTPAPEYHIGLGDLYTVSGNENAARQEYDLVRGLDQHVAANHVDNAVELARFEADHNLDLPAALRLAQTEAQVRHDVMTDDTLAWALYKNGRYAEAWHAESEALRLGTHYAPFYYHAGMIQAKLRKIVEAQSYLHSALMLNPSFNVLDASAARTELLHLNHAASAGA